MRKVGYITSLYYSTEIERVQVEALMLDEKGIIKDKHYNKNIERSVLLVSIDSYILAEKHGIKVPTGSFGENFLMDYNPYSLPTGSKLKIGNAILEISQHCTLCKSLSKIDSKLPKLLKDDRGIFARVVKEGIIKKGDQVYIIKERK